MQRSAVAQEVSNGQGRNLVYCVAKGNLTFDDINRMKIQTMDPEPLHHAVVHPISGGLAGKGTHDSLL